MKEKREFTQEKLSFMARRLTSMSILYSRRFTHEAGLSDNERTDLLNRADTLRMAVRILNNDDEYLLNNAEFINENVKNAI